MMLSQFQANAFLFTYLEEYKTNPSTASPWLSIGVYDELITSNGLGLIRTDFMPSVSKKEANVVTEMLLDRYGASFSMWLEPFNSKPNSFNFDQYIQDSNKFTNKFLD